MELKSNIYYYKLFFMEDTVKLFLAGLQVYAKRNRVNQTKLGKVVGRGQTTISDYFKGVTRPEDWMINKWIDHYSLNREEIVNAGRQIEAENKQQFVKKQNIEENNITEIHQDTVTRFIDKKKGLAANEALLIIERHNPIKFIDVVADLEKIAKQIQINEKSGDEWNSAINQE